MLPPPCWPIDGVVGYDISDVIIEKEIVPALRELAAEEGVETVDLFGVFTDRPELFADGVHPTAEGAGVLAEAVYQAILSKGE